VLYQYITEKKYSSFIIPPHPEGVEHLDAVDTHKISLCDSLA